MLENQSIKKNGYALLMFVVALLGVGGIALTGINENIRAEAEAEKLKHNQRVLNEAKQALLLYAYSYPANANGGPGRLPCPDTDTDDGNPNATAYCKFVVTGGQVGRLPWKALGLKFYDARDASGERLWYAVSQSFANNGPSTINSDTVGTITIRDQTGNIKYDGAVNGVAAVIIAPGERIKTDANDDGVFEYVQVRNTDDEKKDPANYLDTAFGGTARSEDNSRFFNGSSASGEGFILGPVLDGNNNLIVNDQAIVVTAAEVIAVAEKATLLAYQRALADYANTINNFLGTGSAVRYPWLNAYNTIADLNIYDVAPGATNGRIPSIFGNYFQNNNTEAAFSDISLDYRMRIVMQDDTNDLDVFNGVYPVDTLTGRASISFTSTGQLPGTSGSTASGGITGPTYYFWDEYASPDGWELCRMPRVTFNERDCNQAASGGFVADPWTEDNALRTRVRKLTLKTSFDEGFTFELDYVPAPVITYAAADATNHAKITASFNAGDATRVADFVYFDLEQDNNYNVSFDPTEPAPTGSIGTLGIDEDVGVTADVSFDQFDLTLDYFPVLPAWAADAENNWNSSIMMAYANSNRPGGSGNCLVLPDCITVNNLVGANNVSALLVLAGQHNWNPPPLNLASVFEGDNATPADDIFDARPANSNDKVFVLAP